MKESLKMFKADLEQVRPTVPDLAEFLSPVMAAGLRNLVLWPPNAKLPNSEQKRPLPQVLTQEVCSGVQEHEILNKLLADSDTCSPR